MTFEERGEDRCLMTLTLSYNLPYVSQRQRVHVGRTTLEILGAQTGVTLVPFVPHHFVRVGPSRCAYSQQRVGNRSCFLLFLGGSSVCLAGCCVPAFRLLLFLDQPTSSRVSPPLPLPSERLVMLVSSLVFLSHTWNGCDFRAFFSPRCFRCDGVFTRSIASLAWLVRTGSLISSPHR